MDESRQSELKAFTNRFQKTEIIFKILKSALSDVGSFTQEMYST